MYTINQKGFRHEYKKTAKQSKNVLNKKVYNEWKKAIFLYFCLAAFRIIVTCIPQTGYVHPDEYFQSIEVIAGDTFDVDYKRPWEFNHTQPIRSIIIPYLTVGIPYKLLKIVDTTLVDHFKITINKPYFLLIFPRLLICFSSFVVDFCLYKICKINKDQYVQKLLFLSSSYIMFVYGTRTFSNTVEMVLMSLLLFLVADSQAYSRSIIVQNEYLSDRYRKSKAAVDKARFYKLRMLLPSHSMRHCIAISVITVTGVFNRPTFAAFALSPVFFWFHRGLGFKSVRFTEFHTRMFLFLLYSIVMVFTYILVDSFYFGHICMAEVLSMDVSMKNFVVTPLNFIKYNMDVKNLSEHGLHPRSLHLLVNIPLLYNVLGIVTIAGMSSMLYKLLMGRYRSLPPIYSIKGLMTASIIAPTAVLSYFPHQEARFLIPITLPIILLFSNTVIQKARFYKMWLVLNVSFLVFYGFVHQAGIYPATVHIGQEIMIKQSVRPIHLVTSNVYSLPVSLFQQDNAQKLYHNGKTVYKKPRTLLLQEFGSTSLELVTKHLTVIQATSQKPIFLLLPTSKTHELFIHVADFNLTLTEVKTFYPHLSTEALPDFLLLLSNFYRDASISNLIYER